MRISRRRFVGGSAAMSLALPWSLKHSAGVGPRISVRASAAGFDPLLEIDAAALGHNAAAVAGGAGGRPVLAVVKNNAYGFGLEHAGPILDAAPGIAGLAVVKGDAAFALRNAGVSKPILLMARVEDDEAEALARAEVRLAPFGDGAAEQLSRLAGRLDRPIPAHAYLDTGMSRLGTPFRHALPFLRQLAESGAARIEGTFMGFTEEDDFDPLQLARFDEIAESARREGIELGALHAASSHALFFNPDALLDMVRPGLVLYGAYPSGARQLERLDLVPAFRLSARVVRVVRLEAGDSVSYGREYVAERPTWIATIPVGHADGYPRRAVEGCEVLIGDRSYPVIGAVSASHTIVELGDEPTAAVGDRAVLVGPDDPAIHPNAVAERAGVSVYDVLMHLNSALPRVLLD